MFGVKFRIDLICDNVVQAARLPGEPTVHASSVHALVVVSIARFEAVVDGVTAALAAFLIWVIRPQFVYVAHGDNIEKGSPKLDSLC